jgi:hypothetical protein
MISDLLQDLINRINTVPALSGKVGAAVGGTATDPTMSEAPVPFAWVIFGGDTPINDAEGGQNYRRVVYNFTVVTAVGYGITEQEMFDTSMPVLEDIQYAVAGLQGDTKYVDLWKYEGSELQAVFPSRLVYHINFSIIGHHQV